MRELVEAAPEPVGRALELGPQHVRVHILCCCDGHEAKDHRCRCLHDESIMSSLCVTQVFIV